MRRDDYLGVGYFVHPIPAVAVLLMTVNDHYLKARFPGWWTGKLSDFAGLFFFPLFLCAMGALIEHVLRGSRPWISARRILTAIVVTDLVFMAVKTSPEAATLYEHSLAALGFPARLTLDKSDLVALASNILTYLYARAFWLEDAPQGHSRATSSLRQRFRFL